MGEDGRSFRGSGVDASNGAWLPAPCVDGAGNLYFLDPDRRQVERVPVPAIVTPAAEDD